MDEDLAARDSQLRSGLAGAAAAQRTTSAGLIDAELTAALAHARAEIHMRDKIISSQSAFIANLEERITGFEEQYAVLNERVATPATAETRFSRAFNSAADRLRPTVDRLPAPVKSAAYGASHAIRKLGSRR